jgi:hypothetical protein
MGRSGSITYDTPAQLIDLGCFGLSDTVAAVRQRQTQRRMVEVSLLSH